MSTRAPRDLRRTLTQAVRRAAAPLGSVYAVRTGERVVLTYDDGPEPGGTDAVLAALADAGVHATFFVLVTRARRYPSLLAEVVAAGHEIGLHGIDHRPLPLFTAREVHRRSADGRAELEDRTGRPIRWLRPPYGRLRPGGHVAIRAAGMMPVLWGPSTRDSVPATPAERIERAVVTDDGAQVSGGAILLSHDGYAGPDDGVDDGPAPTFDRGALAAGVIARYRELGLVAGSLGEAVATGAVRRSATFTG